MRIRLKQNRLTELLSASGISQNHWAIKLGLSRGHWSGIVNGNHPYPSAKTRERMLDGFAVSFAELFELEVAADPWVDVDFRRAIMDRFVIDTEIGQGGMGAVYLARDVRQSRLVAIKVVAPEAISGIGLAQFKREVSTVAQLQHPNVLPLFETGDVAGHPYFVMPYVRGGSLRALLAARGFLPPLEALSLISGIADALHYAHGEHTLHCDVKPENVLLHKNHAWVTDFGIARRLHAADQEWPTREGLDISAGTPAYVSPEQASGETDLDARSDVYSFACMTYEMLSGRTPFNGTTTQQIVVSRFVSPPPRLTDIAPHISNSVHNVVERAMSLQREKRPASAEEFASELQEAAHESPRVFVRAANTAWRAVTRIERKLEWSSQRPLGGIVRAFMEDIRYAVRMCSRNRLVTSAIIATMVLGIGVATAVFGVVNGVLLKPLPFDNSGRVVRLGMTLRDGGFTSNVAYPDFQDFQRNSKLFSSFAAVEVAGITMTEGALPERLTVINVSPGFADVLSIKPVVGRFFSSEEFNAGSASNVMISHSLWKRQFNADKAIVGRTIRLNNEARTIVGVLAESAYSYPVPNIDVVTPLKPRVGTYQMNRGALWLRAVARMKPGVTFPQAQAEISALADGIALQHPEANKGIGARAELLVDAEAAPARSMLWLLSAAVVGVLLIACVNIANVLLGQSRARAREFAVRAALGGSAGRIRRQLITESLFLAAIGGSLGVAVAPVITRALISFYPGTLPRAEEVSLDWRVVAFALLAIVLAGLAAGIPTAWRVLSLNLSRDLREGGRSGSAKGQQRVGSLLIVSQVAISLVLLASAALLLRTFQTLSRTSPGFDPTGVTTFALNVPSTRYSSDSARRLYYERVGDALRVLPGVTNVATSSEIPYSGSSFHDVFIIKELGDQGVNNPMVRVGTVSSDYWRLLRVPLISGRTFSTQDRSETAPVVVINEALARRYYPNANPIGHRIEYNRREREIIGVVASIAMEDLSSGVKPELYLPSAQSSLPSNVLVKSALLPATIIPAIRSAVRDVDPTIAVSQMETLQEKATEVLAPQRFRAALVTGLGLLGLLLSALGIYGVVTHAITRQTREIGIRIALGESQSRVQWRMVSSVLATTAAGALLGVALSLGISRWLSTFLIGVSARDPLTLWVSASLLLLLAAVAAYVPARRASRCDPLLALRSE